VSETVRPGWFSDAEEGKAPEVRDNIDRALDELGRELEARG